MIPQSISHFPAKRQPPKPLPRPGNVAPPPPNRGAQPTPMAQKPPIAKKPKLSNQESGLFLDYLRGTIPAYSFFQVTDDETGEAITKAEPNYAAIESIFGPMTPLGYSTAAGYDQTAALACGGSVSWHTTKPEQRVLINLGGSALAMLGLHPIDLMKKLTAQNFQVTRFDWAKDDTTGLLDLELIRLKLQRQEVVTRFRKFDESNNRIIGEAAPEGETVYIGQRVSESFIRCYDKAAETAKRTGIKVDGIWIRVEVEVKRHKAQELWRQILEAHQKGGDTTVSALVLGVVLGLIDFKEPTTDSNKSRWPTCAWWSKFLGINEKVRITIPKPVITLDRAKDWLIMIAPTVAIVNEIDPAFLGEAMTSGKSKWRPTHKAKFARWQLEHDQARSQITELNKAITPQGGGG